MTGKKRSPEQLQRAPHTLKATRCPTDVRPRAGVSPRNCVNRFKVKKQSGTAIIASVGYRVDGRFFFFQKGNSMDTRTEIKVLLESKVGKALLREIQNAKYDIDSIVERDPAALGRAEVILLYSGVHALMAHRISHFLHKHNLKLSARAVSQLAKMLTGIEIHPGATIGRGLFIDHGTGVVIGETAEIGDNCTIYQGVTLGGTGKETGKRHPTLGNNVMVGAGAKLLGNFTVGDNSKIAAGAVVLGDVPENSTAVGIPAHVVRRGGEKITNDLDQVHIPDPIENEITALRERITKLEEEIRNKREEGGNT